MGTDKRRCALVTGASSGIGAAFTQRFAKEGFDLIVTARRIKRLEELKQKLEKDYGVEVMVIGADLADPAAPKQIVERIAASGMKVDVLINNAGYGLPGTYADTRWQDQATFLQVLVTAVCELTHRLLPPMIERGYGRIINVSSVAGLVPGSAGHTLYGAAKSFLVAFTESLYLELENTGVHATVVCPGFTYSEFHDVTGTRALVNQLPSFMWMDADTVARQAIRASMNGDLLCVNGIWNKLLTVACRFIPYRLAMSISRSQSKRLRSQEHWG
jgi:short-subunit dehydrogenase